MKYFICATLMLVIVSCSSSYIVDYSYSAEKILSKFPNSNFQEILMGRYNLLYTDSNIILSFDMNPSEVGLQLKNIGETEINIIWDKTFLQSEFDPIKKFKLRPKEIVNGTSIKSTDFIIPPTKIKANEIITAILVNEKEGDFFPYSMGVKDILSNSANEIKGKSLVFNLAIEANNTIKEITLKTKITDYWILEHK